MEALYKYQEYSPPVHQLVATYMGIKKPPPALPAENQGAALMQMIQGMNG